MAEKICPYQSCTGCGACASVCPKHCVAMNEDAEGFLRPSVDESFCISCGACAKVCPVNGMPQKHVIRYVTAANRDDRVLRSSSSGGVFTALADAVFAEGGVAAGAAQDDAARVVFHTIARNREELAALTRSKYYQSETRGIYRDVRKMLMAGRTVLFTGTACQVDALYRYLGEMRHSGRLYTADVLCHGVTSRFAVDAYLCDQEKRYRKKIRRFRFRVKSGDGPDALWKQGGGTRMRIAFEDGTAVLQDQALDSFFCAFNSNLILRESCYTCRYAGAGRVADLTLADYWGADPAKLTQRQADLGLSVVSVNTKRGEELLRKAAGSLDQNPVSAEDARRNNLAFVRPQSRPKDRSGIFGKIRRYGFDRTVHASLGGYYFRQTVKKCLKAARANFRSLKRKGRR